MSFKNKILLVGLSLLFLIGIPAVVFLSQQQQETRSRASASTTLYFTPVTSPSSPAVKNIGDPVSFDVMVTPGSNRPSYIKLEIAYDPSKLQPTSSPFVVNTAAFPGTPDGPLVRNNTVLIAVNVGSDPARAISTTTKVGTVNFTATAPTSGTPTVISFGAQSQVLSVASTDQSSENVLSATQPAYISVVSAPTATATPTPIRKAGDGASGGRGGGTCGGAGSNGGVGSNSTGGTGGTGGTGCSGSGSGNAGGIGGTGGLGSATGPGNPGQNGANGTGTGAGGGGGGGGGGAPGQAGGRGGDGGNGCGGAGQLGEPGELAPNPLTGGKGGKGGDGGPGCTVSPTPSTQPTIAVSPTTPPVGPTKISLTVLLHGIGASGDNANPTNATLSNKSPLTTTRTVVVEVLNNAGTVVATTNANVVYDSASGSFKGIADFGSNIPTSGSYSIKVKPRTHLRRLASGIQTITLGQTNTLPALDFTAGDVDNNNSVNILDYNLLIGCYSDLSPAASCNSTNQVLTDLNDDGRVNQFDYNLFLREITVQNGQ